MSADDCFHWIDDDSGYEKWLSEHPNGFMANLNREPHVKYFRIHRATHRLPDRSNPGSSNPRTGNNYSKVTTEKLSDLLEWAKVKIPDLVLGEANFCKACNPASGESPEFAPTPETQEYIFLADQLVNQGNVPRPDGVQQPQVKYSQVPHYYRDPKVRAWTIQRSGGECELCNSPAPFLMDGDVPFLESHHLVPLAKGGADTPTNTAALCPNCHRKIHLGSNRDELTEMLAIAIAAKESQVT
ncbi:HNH endonuclease [Schlesneria sp. DSM 10557]|uniref:HNH endonuclease n=1 Tax=Schlesneria sp. DSM 10557 TaxID=3044399 RepID=UPI00359F317A